MSSALLFLRYSETTTIIQVKQFQLIFMLTNKAGSGLCPLLLLCPMPKQKTKPTKSPVYSALDEYENHILSIVENRDSSNLSPQMEYLYEELINQLPMETIKSIGGIFPFHFTPQLFNFQSMSRLATLFEISLLQFNIIWLIVKNICIFLLRMFPVVSHQL